MLWLWIKLPLLIISACFAPSGISLLIKLNPLKSIIILSYNFAILDSWDFLCIFYILICKSKVKFRFFNFTGIYSLKVEAIPWINLNYMML